MATIVFHFSERIAYDNQFNGSIKIFDFLSINRKLMKTLPVNNFSKKNVSLVKNSAQYSIEKILYYSL